MGFDSNRVVVSSSSFSVASGKQKHRSINVANATDVPDSLKPIARKDEENIPISPFRSWKGNDSMNMKFKNGGKYFCELKSGSKSNMYLNVNAKGNGFSNLPPVPITTSPCDTKKRHPHLHSIPLNEESPKSARTDSSKTPVSIGNKNFINENFDNTHYGVLAPKGPHSRNILSFGNIYKASKNLVLERDPPLSKDVQFNDIVAGVKGKMDSRVSERNRSNNHVLGFGGCNYGHGSIVKNVKNAEKFTSNGEVICNKNKTERHNCLIPRTAPQFETVEELKNAGNEEYRRGCFMEAISFYNKAIDLCPRNAACHNNKAAALTGLGCFMEAVGKCLEAINCDPSYSRAHYRLGTLYTRLGRVDDAKWHFKVSGHDLGSEAVQRLLHLEAHLIDMEKARKVENWDRVLTESTLSIEAGADASDQVVAVKAEALLKLHRAKEALELLMAARHSDKSRSRKACKGTSCLLIIETQLYLYLGRFEEGILAAEQAVNLDSNSKSLMWLRKAKHVADAWKAGNELFKAGNYLEACTMYGQGLHYAPTNSVLLCNLAACRSKLGQWEMAIDNCNAALRNRPGYSKALLRRAYSNARLERWDESLRDYSVLSKAMPGDHAISSSLLQVQMELKKAQGF